MPSQERLLHASRPAGKGSHLELQWGNGGGNIALPLEGTGAVGAKEPWFQRLPGISVESQASRAPLPPGGESLPDFAEASAALAYDGDSATRL